LSPLWRVPGHARAQAWQSVRYVKRAARARYARRGATSRAARAEATVPRVRAGATSFEFFC